MNNGLDSVIDCCQKAIQKDVWTAQDEADIQNCIHKELSTIDDAVERHTFRSEVMAHIREILLIQKYRAVYLKGVTSGFNEEQFLKKIDQAFYNPVS
jgi:hypothetical protein